MLILKAKGRRAAQDLDNALKTLEPKIALAFRRAVKSVRDKATLSALSTAITAGDLNRAVEIVTAQNLAGHLAGVGLLPGERSAQDELVEAFRTGGAAGMRQLPKVAGLAATLDLTNPEAVTFLRETLPTLIREVGEGTQRVVQQAVLRGFEEGRSAPKIAREIRESIGLTSKQSRAIGNFRRQLETGELGRGKVPWDRRLSAVERNQAKRIFVQGGASGPQVDKLVERYHQSLVNRRAKDIARTEVHRAHVAGQEELWNQAAGQGLLDPNRTKRKWIVTPDDRLRPDHAAIPGMNPEGVGLNELFQTPFGPVMGPNDPVPELINCRCTVALEFE